MTIYLTNPKKSGQPALIKIQRPDGEVMTLKAGSNARRYALKHQEAVRQAAGVFFAENAKCRMGALFSACKGRVEMARKVNGMGDATWSR